MTGRRSRTPESRSSSSSLLPYIIGAAIGAAAATASAGAIWFSKKEEKQMKTNPVSKPNDYAQPTTDSDPDVLKHCEICFMSFKEIKLCDDNAIMSTPCGHMFCKICILESLKRKTECPNCRRQITDQNLTRLYM